MRMFKLFWLAMFYLVGCFESRLESKQLFPVVLLLSATFGYGLLQLPTKIFTFRSTPKNQILHEVDFSHWMFCLLSKFTLTTISFCQLDVSELATVLLHPPKFVIRESNDAWEFHITNAMGFPQLSKGCPHSEYECRRGVRHNNNSGRGEQLLLVYLSPGCVEFTPFLLSLPIPGNRVDGQTFRLRLARQTLQRAFKKTSPPDFLSWIHLNKNYHFHPNSFSSYNLLAIIYCIFF